MWEKGESDVGGREGGGEREREREREREGEEEMEKIRPHPVTLLAAHSTPSPSPSPPPLSASLPSTPPLAGIPGAVSSPHSVPDWNADTSPASGGLEPETITITTKTTITTYRVYSMV